MATLVGLLVVVSALTRSAQGPLGGWLPPTVSAPTPLSALLHAGVVNGGGILLVRLGVLSGASLPAMVGVFAVGAVTAIVAGALVTHKADVKGSLVFSTMSQMGFMVAECAVGASLAAVVHLIGHALYKATLFFGSGSQVPRAGQAPIMPAAAVPLFARVAATVAPSALSVAAIAAIEETFAIREPATLLIFASATCASASWSWSSRRLGSPRLMTRWVTGMVVAGALYGLVLGGLGAWITPALPPSGAGTLSPWWLAAVAAVGIFAARLAAMPAAKRWRVAILVNAATPPVKLLSGGSRGTPRYARDEGRPVEFAPSWEWSTP
jgi:NADH:ubiquinone oxidoreductase subunit 5 (subunit L)/multisubunit Na+/H+ antiporter MnhA subunit